MANSTLDAVILKVRRLTRSPNQNTLSEATIIEYINTFIQYDFPEHLRLFSLKTTLEFYTQPNIDTYPPNTTVPTDPLFQFDQRYITFEGPVYIAGFEAQLSQSREEFFRIYPFVNSVVDTQLRGDGVTLVFAGTLGQIPMLQGQVVFTVLGANNVGLILTDGTTVLPSSPVGLLTSPDGLNFGTINYLTGAFTLTFATAPALNEPIFAETVPYVAARPNMLLYFHNTFFVRPVPDKAYKIIINAYIRPSELLAGNQSPELQQWWQYIAYGASKKIFEDRMDVDSVALIMPEYNKQERLVSRRTIVQQANERVATIYVNQTQSGSGFSPYGNPF